MAVTFDGTSKTNLIIHPIDPERHAPLKDMGQAMAGSPITYQAREKSFRRDFGKSSNLHCVFGSDLNDSSSSTSAASTKTTLPTYSGVIGTILTAYNSHQNLVIRPDDIFIMILAQFSAYLNGEGRAEELRSKFVNHEGQMELEVTDAGSVCNAPYARMTRTFLDRIAENLVDPTLKEWFLPGFSTTTFKDEVVASASAMCAFQAYFSYEYSLICGIPQITLQGTVEDWELLRTKVERLVEYDDQTKVMSQQWVPLLRNVLDNFVETARNGGSTNNQDFWDQIVFYYHDYGCAKETYLTGWLSVFTFFDGKGEIGVYLDQPVWPRISLDSIHNNVVSCPVKIDDNGVEYNATLYAGSMAFDYEPLLDLDYTDFPSAVRTPKNQGVTLHNLVPRTDWAMAVWERTGGAGASRPDTLIEDAVQKWSKPGEQCEDDVSGGWGLSVPTPDPALLVEESPPHKDPIPPTPPPARMAGPDDGSPVNLIWKIPEDLDPDPAQRIPDPDEGAVATITWDYPEGVVGWPPPLPQLPPPPRPRPLPHDYGTPTPDPALLHAGKGTPTPDLTNKLEEAKGKRKKKSAKRAVIRAKRAKTS